MLRYSLEKPTAGATTAYSGKKSMVNMKDPGIARCISSISENFRVTHERTGDSVFGPETICQRQRPG